MCQNSHNPQRASRRSGSSDNTADGAGAGVLNRENSNGMFTNYLFTGNAAVSSGGGMVNRVSSMPTLANCTFTGNSATDGGAIFNKDSVPTVSNCILWGDTPDEIYVVSGSAPVVAYSDVQGGWVGTGNIDADPQFAGADDYRLSSGSPCIDAADNFAVPADVTDLDNDADVAERTPLDLDLNPRFINDENTTDTGVADPPNYPDVVDMGAYEFGAFCYGDITGDGFINLSDLAQLLGHYGETGASYEDGDLDGDGDVDLSDLAEMLGLYNTPCP
jgi:predicted outer membrane repeat protein